MLQYTYRQTICPPTRLGRLNAAVRTMTGVETMTGAVLGGIGAEILETRLTIGLATTLACMGALSLIIGSPLRRRRDLVLEPRPVCVVALPERPCDPQPKCRPGHLRVGRFISGWVGWVAGREAEVAAGGAVVAGLRAEALGVVLPLPDLLAEPAGVGVAQEDRAVEPEQGLTAGGGVWEPAGGGV